MDPREKGKKQINNGVTMYYECVCFIYFLDLPPLDQIWLGLVW